jgi:hypothetical protein
MARATCTTCGNVTYWRAQRGVRLADHKCSSCGGELQGMTAGRKSAAKGRRLVKCAACGKRTAFAIVLPITLRIGFTASGQQVISAGQSVCKWHETQVPEPIAVKFGFLVLVDEDPQEDRWWGVPVPQYLAKLEELSKGGN